MTDYRMPAAFQVDLTTGMFPNPVNLIERHLSDMGGYYADKEAEAALADANPLIYTVYEPLALPSAPGMLLFSTTIIEPGTIGGEYFMTKGHYHALGDRTELYYGLQGEGMLELQTREGQVEILKMSPGTAAFIPPYWAHRTMNTGNVPFAFLSCFNTDAGYDYAAIGERGFAEILIAQNGVPTLMPNWKRV